MLIQHGRLCSVALHCMHVCQEEKRVGNIALITRFLIDLVAFAEQTVSASEIPLFKGIFPKQAQRMCQPPPVACLPA